MKKLIVIIFIIMLCTVSVSAMPQLFVNVWSANVYVGDSPIYYCEFDTIEECRHVGKFFRFRVTKIVNDCFLWETAYTGYPPTWDLIEAGEICPGVIRAETIATPKLVINETWGAVNATAQGIPGWVKNDWYFDTRYIFVPFVVH